MMNHKPERAAWFVMWGAFLTFLVLCAAMPLGAQYYLEHATTPQLATLEVIGGTVRAREPSAAAPIAVTKTVQLPEGTAIETDENSRAILTFSDGSTTVLFPNTQIFLRQMRVATFPWGVEPLSIILEQTRGRLRVGAAQQVPQANETPRPRVFQVFTQHLGATLAEGSYAVEIRGDATEVSVRDGTATVSAQDKTVKVGRSQRTLARRNEAPLASLPAAQDLIVNGDFMDPRSRGWNDQIEIPSPAGAPAGRLS
ncbi:MAG: FecR domain-containing protein, partial [Chloroflexota bacterium]